MTMMMTMIRVIVDDDDDDDYDGEDIGRNDYDIVDI